MRVIAMPGDTNPDGDIFGGWLLGHMDLAAGSVATKLSQGCAASIAVESMSFLRSVKVGDEASVYAGIVKTRRSSMQISVEAWRRPRWSEKEEKVTKAIFTFVAIGPNGRPRALGAASQTVDASRQTVSRLSRADVTGKWRWREHKRRILRNGAKRL